MSELLYKLHNCELNYMLVTLVRLDNVHTSCNYDDP